MIYNWTMKAEGKKLAMVQSFATNIEQEKVVTRALDGGIYIQTIGTGTKTADITLFVSSRQEREAVNEAEAMGTLVDVLYRDVTYHGYIEAAPQWAPVIEGRCYTGKCKLLLEVTA